MRGTLDIKTTSVCRPVTTDMWRVTCVVVSLLTLLPAPVLSASLSTADHTDEASGLFGLTTSVAVMLIVLSGALIVCSVLLVLGCADICQRHSGFKDFENDAFTEDSLSPVPVAPSEFTMYPPVENTPDPVTPVVFEPLPDITLGHQAAGRGVRASARLRPRVTQDVYERSDSVDSLDDVSYNQDKLRLQNVLTNSRHQVPRGQLQYIKEMGSGWFGKVLQGEGHGILPGHKKTKVVIQMLKEEPDSGDQLAFLEEVLPYRDTDHPNVLTLLGQCVDTTPYLNILELCPFGDLKTYLRSHRVAMESFNEKGLLLKFACDMAAGLQALHQEGFIHRDFATRNCVLSSDLSVKVGDYGLSEELFREDYYQTPSGDAVPVRWLAPECLLVSQEQVAVRKISKEANIWAYGVTLWEILTFGSLPYGDLTNNHVLRLVVLERSVQLPKPDVTATNLDRIYQLMKLCWVDPDSRPSLRELRIMLLHLLSRKDDSTAATSAFDAKWNQLLPRRSPRVTRVATAAQNGGVKAGGAGRPGAIRGVEPVYTSQGPISSSKPNGEVTSPVNEMSLEAEFSAANIRASESSEEEAGGSHALTTDSGVVVSPPPPQQKVQVADVHKPIDLLSPIKDAAPVAKDQVVPGDVTPDVVVSETPNLDFVTSTPKRPGAAAGSPDDERFLTLDSSEDPSDGQSSQYQTAPSAESSLTADIDDRSFMAPQKFADLLQTVAMTPSLDYDTTDTSAENSPFVLDLSEEDVFRSPSKSPRGALLSKGALAPLPESGDAGESAESAESTPRNTPTPVVTATSDLETMPDLGTSAALLETSNQEEDSGRTVTPTPDLAPSAAPLLDISVGEKPGEAAVGEKPADSSTAQPAQPAENTGEEELADTFTENIPSQSADRDTESQNKEGSANDMLTELKDVATVGSNDQSDEKSPDQSDEKSPDQSDEKSRDHSDSDDQSGDFLSAE